VVAQLALYGWFPATIALFAIFPARRAVMFSAIGAILFLPSGAIDVPGVPGGWNRYSAFALSSFVGILLFDSGRLFRIQPRWFDLPIFVIVFAPIVTSVLNGFGVYDGLSQALRQAIFYGFPYFYGRIYVTGASAAKDVALAIVMGGLLYAPLSLFEVRMSPQLHYWVYGYQTIRFVLFRRFGGFRPIVFMDSPLMLGMWMSATSILVVWIAMRCPKERILGFPLSRWALLPVAALLLGKTMAAITIFLIGIGLLWASRLFRTTLFVVAIMAGFMSYPILRTTQILERDMVIGVVTPIFPAPRVASLDYRVKNEDKFIQRALERPFFGWGGWARNRTDTSGAIDGLWIITFGKFGFVSLIALMGLFAAPISLLLRRVRPRRWGEPAVAPVAALGVMLAVYWIDCLSNAFINPMYIFAMGGLNTLLGTSAIRTLQPPAQKPGEPDEPEVGDQPPGPDEAAGARMADLIGGRRGGLPR